MGVIVSMMRELDLVFVSIGFRFETKNPIRVEDGTGTGHLRIAMVALVSELIEGHLGRSGR